MAARSPATLRAFVRRHTALRPVPDVPDVRLQIADDVMEVCRLAGLELGQADPPLPYWAFPWAGGLAVVGYLLDHPEAVAGKGVLDLATGSGLCAIVAARLGAASVIGADIDPLAEAAFTLNTRANRVRIGFRHDDLLDDAPPAVDVILAGDVSYEETMARPLFPWLRVAARSGTRVIVGA